MSFDLIQQSEEASYLAPGGLAPGGSEIRLLAEVAAGGWCHCTLPPWQNAAAVVHKTVDEVWYCMEGQGEVWRRHGDDEEAVVEMRSGTSLTIPVRTHFQFRNTGSTPLCLLIATMPRWPGPEEALTVAGRWRSS